MEKDELPSANEQMGMYRQQTRPRDDDVSLEAINDYVKERFMAPSQGYARLGMIRLLRWANRVAAYPPGS